MVHRSIHRYETRVFMAKYKLIVFLLCVIVLRVITSSEGLCFIPSGANNTLLSDLRDGSQNAEKPVIMKLLIATVYNVVNSSAEKEVSKSNQSIFKEKVAVDSKRGGWLDSFFVRLIIFITALLFIYSFMRLLYHRQNLKYSWKTEKMEKQMIKEINDAKIRFFTDLSHDLKTPLTLIQAPIQRLYNSGTFNEGEVKKILPVIYQNSQRLTILIEELLTFRKLTNAKQKLQASQLNFIGFIKGILEYYENTCEEKQISIDKQFESDNITAWFDPFKMEQVMHNLLSNSFKYVSEKGVIKISVSTTRGPYISGNETRDVEWVALTVYNDSNYISPEKLEKLFDRFYQVDEKNSGTGIGLSIAKSLVDLHHGNIEVHSSKESGGVEFRIEIPKNDDFLALDEKTNKGDYVPMSRILSDGVESLSKESANFQKNLKTKQKEHEILLIEDNRDLREFLSHSLSSEYQVNVAENGEAGIRLAEELIPDIIISDVIMPKMNGYEVVQAIKNNLKTSHIPVILLTAKSTNEDKITGFHSGADAYVVKPFNLEVLVAQIERVIKNKEIMQRNYKEWIHENRKPTTMSNEDHSFMNLVNRQIDLNISNGDINVNELSELIGLSTTQVYRKIKALTSHTPVEYIRIYKLRKAQRLLSNYKYSVKQIAYMSGFNDPSYFGKCFKKEFGISPQLYRSNFLDYKIESKEISQN